MKKVNIRSYGKRAYLQLENNRFLRGDGILLFVDLDKSTYSGVTRAFLKKKEKEGQIRTASAGLPKSFVVYDDGRKEEVCLSVFSADVLAKRLTRE